MIDLLKFCAKERSHKHDLRKPFLWDRGRVVATDGVVMVCVSEPPTAVDLQEAPNFKRAKIIDEVLAIDARAAFSPLPEQDYCLRCLGSGVIMSVEKCEECGQACISYEDCCLVPVGRWWFKRRYFNLLAALPELRWTEGKTEWDGQCVGSLVFRFDGGVGALVGCHKESWEAALREIDELACDEGEE